MKIVPTLALALCVALAGCAGSPAQSSLPTQTTAFAHAWLEIDADAFEHNVRAMQAELAGKSQLCAVMKADAYGHGLTLLMPSLLALEVECVAITSNTEAAAVRQSGFKGRLLRLRSATVDEIADALRYDVEEVAGNLALMQLVSRLAGERGVDLPVHLALNSAGISRMGLELSTEQGQRDALAIAKLPHLKIVGVMTHFPVEEQADIRRGFAAFQRESSWVIEHAGLDRAGLTLHTANSYATLEVPETRLDLVRVGGALFGDTVPSRTEYRRVMQFKSRVTSVNPYPRGNNVGYDRTTTLTRDSLLANIAVGYADGYRRAFSNKAHVLIRGQRAPVVGKVSMNMLMVDVTDVPGVAPGDEVVLFGRQGAVEITQPELEDANGALLADLYTVWGNSNPRILKRAR